MFNCVLWQKINLSIQARKENCSLLFIPGESFLTDFRPIVTMSQNLIPFEWSELRRYGISLITLKWLLLRYSQSKLFKKEKNYSWGKCANETFKFLGSFIEKK